MKYIFTLLLGIFMLSAQAQEHVCGTTIQDQLKAEAMFRLAGPSKLNHVQMRESVYIPVAFHIVTQGNGKGGVKHSDILKQLCRLNNDYAEWDIVFYPIHKGNYPVIKNSTLYTDPRTNENQLRAKKVDNALNVFIVGDIGESGAGTGTVLGYYSPTNDLVVCKIAEFQQASTTMSHELGHFFSLRHTFFGWEGCPYDQSAHGNPVESNVVPCFDQVAVENMDGSNCDVAADQICDTPPDYNFGLSAYSNGCALTIDVKDPKGVSVETMANNQMSYFQTCPEYFFTAQQIDRFLNNYNNASRDFLKSTYVPNETEITSAPSITSPSNNDEIETYNGVSIEWTEIPEADHYLIELNGFDATYRAYYSDVNAIFIKNLDKNTKYTAKVTPFNDGYHCVTGSSAVFFDTGSTVTSTDELSIFNAFNLAPNPAKDELFVTIDSESTQNYELRVYSLDGKLSYSSDAIINKGNNKINIDLTDCKSGIHILQIKTTEGQITEKFTVTK